MNQHTKGVGLLTAAVLVVTGVAFDTGADTALHAAAASYPVQEFRMGIANTNRNVNISAAENGAPVTSDLLNGSDNEEWTLSYIEAGVYEIVNVASGMLLTADASGYCTITADADAANQRWNIAPVEQDFEGYDLYYKITSNADSSKALTFTPETNSFTADAYSGAEYQKYKLNLNGLEGFAANVSIEGGQKAGTIGGLLGPTVFVSTADELEKQLDSVGAQTIVVTADINMQSKSHTRVRDFKTIVGSFSANTVQDPQFRTNDVWGAEDDSPSDNIVFRNIHFTAKNVPDRIQVNIWSSRQIWIDHCTFTNYMTRSKDEVGKFIWINTPYESYHDAKDMWRSPDYVTISYCRFTNRYWTVAYGTQNGEITRDRTTLLCNWWENCARRCPQIGNGIGHIYNNYYSFTESESSQQIIGGDGCDLLSENCMFEGLPRGYEIAGGGASDSRYTDSGSYRADSVGGTAAKLNFKSSYPATLTPKNHYGYALIAAYGGNDTKAWCTKYSGCFTTDSAIKFVADSDMAGWVTAEHDTPFLENITVGELSTAKECAVMDTTIQYAFRNYGSGLYLEVADGTAATDSNVQQGSSSVTDACTWSLKDGGDGYYYVLSALGDGKTYYLDLENGSPDNGTNIAIWTDTASDAQLFKFVANDDGTYQIATKASRDASGLGIVAGSTETGANVVQWKYDAAPNQCWVIEPIIAPVSGNLISSMEKKDLDYHSAWGIDTNLQAGDLVFGDREVTFTVIDDALVGSELILTACDSKFTTTELAVITAAEDIILSVGFDARLTAIPAWAARFTKTEMTCTSSNDITFVIYQTKVAAGESIALGAQGTSSGVVNYIAVATAIPQETTTTVPVLVKQGDVNCDGDVKINDVILLNRFLAEDASAIVSEQGMLNAECDGVNGVNGNDSIAILKMLAGL